MKLSFLFILFSYFLIGCNSVNLKKPATRFMSPEANGELLGGIFGLQLAGVANIKMIKEQTSSSPSTNPNIDEAQDIGVQFHLGLSSRIDTYFDSTSVGPNTTGLKFQLLGKPVKEAGTGNTALSIFAGALWGDWEKEDHKNGGQADEVKATSEISVNGYEAGISVGHRVFEEFLLYLTAYHSEIKSKARLDQTDSGVFTQDLVRVEGEGTVQSAALGIVLGKGLFVQIEGAYVIGEWKKTTAPAQKAESLGNFMSGINAGLQW